MTHQIKKHNPTIYCMQETHYKYNNIGRLKVEDGKRFILPTVKGKQE